MLLTASTSTTSEAHCYSRWYYPTPQHCGLKRLHPTHYWKEARFVPITKHEQVENKSISNQTRELDAFVNPGLEVVDWGYADYYGMPVERIRAIALLRALSNVP